MRSQRFVPDDDVTLRSQRFVLVEDVSLVVVGLTALCYCSRQTFPTDIFAEDCAGTAALQGGFSPLPGVQQPSLGHSPSVERAGPLQRVLSRDGILDGCRTLLLSLHSWDRSAGFLYRGWQTLGRFDVDGRFDLGWSLYGFLQKSR